MVKVRFAPSPTGFLHIGGARTALFNWMYARVQGGTFVLRIEDTDQQRSKKEFEEEILDSMRWLGMDWDEVYYQSKRFDIYRQHANKLLEEGKAYKDGEAIILHMPKGEEIKIYDVIRGEITFNTDELKDQVLMKSDGSPAYSFCCVVDDALMGMTAVVRGEDHISNTPKQIVIYNALGFKVPKFAHMPLIMGEDGARLSKRNSAVAVSDYRKSGFLPEALVNYLMLLGWSPGNNQEIISLEQAVKKFSIKKINKAAAAFSMDKLKWINNQYIRQTDTSILSDLLLPYLKDKGYYNNDFDHERFHKIIELFKERLNTLNDFLDWTEFAFTDSFTIEEEAREKHVTPEKSEQAKVLIDKLESLEIFTVDRVEESFKEVVKQLDIKASVLILPVRVALTGKAAGPSLFDIMALLGKEKTLKRLSTTLVFA